MSNMENFIFAVCYTALIMAVSFYYWLAGRQIGIRTSVEIIGNIDPELLIKLRPKLQELLNDATDAKQQP